MPGPAPGAGHRAEGNERPGRRGSRRPLARIAAPVRGPRPGAPGGGVGARGARGSSISLGSGRTSVGPLHHAHVCKTHTGRGPLGAPWKVVVPRMPPGLMGWPATAPRRSCGDPVEPASGDPRHQGASGCHWCTCSMTQRCVRPSWRRGSPRRPVVRGRAGDLGVVGPGMQRDVSVAAASHRRIGDERECPWPRPSRVLDHRSVGVEREVAVVSGRRGPGPPQHGAWSERCVISAVTGPGPPKHRSSGSWSRSRVVGGPADRHPLDGRGPALKEGEWGGGCGGAGVRVRGR